MTNRNFDEWLSKFRPSISSYDYYIDFEKVIKNVDEIKVELNILNSLIGSKNIEDEFEKVVTRYPEVRLVGYPEEVGSIHIDELSAPFDGENRPSIGSVFEAKVLNQKFDNRTQRNLWMLTMNISESSEGEQEETAMAIALKNIKL